MHDYEALHYDKEQLKEACEWQAGWGWQGAARCPEDRPGGHGQLLTACSVLQLCHWAPWWSRETAT